MGVARRASLRIERITGAFPEETTLVFSMGDNGLYLDGDSLNDGMFISSALCICCTKQGHTIPVEPKFLRTALRESYFTAGPNI